MDWSRYTAAGPVTVDCIAGDHMDAVQCIQVHQRISDILMNRSRCES
jgi:hypothetical protein